MVKIFGRLGSLPRRKGFSLLSTHPPGPNNPRIAELKQEETMLNKWKIAVLTIIMSLSAAPAFSQISTATISGVVEDNTGAVIPGATVQLTQTQTNATAQAVSDDRGAFLFPALAIGPYSMKVTASGFGDYQQTNIVLDLLGQGGDAANPAGSRERKSNGDRLIRRAPDQPDRTYP